MTKVDDVLNERGKTHGDFNWQAEVAQQLKGVIHLANFNRQKLKLPMLSFTAMEALEADATKTSRILAGDPDLKEHWLDKAGYATLQANRCSK